MSSLENLNLEENNISDISILSGLDNLKTLNLSKNTSLKNIEPITYLSNLTELRLNGNINMYNLLGVLCDTKTVNNQKVVKLINLKNLYLEKVGNYPNMITTLSNNLTNLEKLYASGNGITSINDIYLLQNLHTLDLSNNSIGDYINNNYGFVRIETIDDERRVVARNYIKELNLSNNGISNTNVLRYIGNDITWLNLQSNNIYDVNFIENFTPNLEKDRLFLMNQVVYIPVKQKTISNQIIILGTLIQNSKDEYSKLYETGTDFTVEGATLNKDNYTYDNKTGNYNTPGNYNIIFDTDKKIGDTATINIKGGRANGSKITFTITNDYYSWDSVVFEDYNLAKAIYNKLQVAGYSILWVPYIINISHIDISNINTINLENYNIKNVKGLESFSNVQNLNLSRNNISSNNEISKINMLKNLTKMVDINLSENDLENADVITNFKNIQRINISNNKISNLDDFYTWKTNLGTNYSRLIELNVSYNNISNIEPIKDITTLQNLNIGSNKINDINLVGNLANLQELNISSNNIIDINILDKLVKLSALNMSNNKIKDISSLSNLVLLKTLNMSNNRITTLDSISNISNLTDLKVNNNKIDTSKDIQYLDLVKNPGLNHQKIFHGITEEDNGIIIVELPDLFKEAKEVGSKVYTEQEITYSNCELDSDKQHIKVDVEKLGNKIAYVTINGGNASGSQFSVAKPVNPTITYSEENRTKGPVVATITFDRQANIINNDGKNTYKFTENGEFTFEYEDEYGFSGTATAKVDYIDNKGPIATITLDKTEITKENVLVTITADEECKKLEGWTLSEDKKTLTKIYESNTKDTGEEIELKDDLGNSTKVTVIVTNIDKEAPVVTGVEEGKTYNASVQIQITEKNLNTIKLTKNGVVVENYDIDKKITEDGEYTLTVTDKAGNITIVNFKISIVGELVVEFDGYQIEQSNKIEYINKIKPETTVEQMKNKIRTNGEVEIYKETTKITDKNAKVGTGMIIKILLGQEKKEYKIVVRGDLTGDGLMGRTDLLKLARYQVGLDKTLQEEHIRATDIYEDKKYAQYSDLLKMARILVGLDSL